MVRNVRRLCRVRHKRSTFLSAVERLELPYYVLKRLANHTVTSDTMAPYRIAWFIEYNGAPYLISEVVGAGRLDSSDSSGCAAKNTFRSSSNVDQVTSRVAIV